ncbi:hypothetical protein RRG08_066070 [Elysia crispata]|uniref:Uncharacterized protein n=1 Tax=Elysia crispata TaxID=231223 RepID=A0AAE0ZGL1_9GAST|nr:hypothetical protein RRG08_066070 [Elysia crispata]
MTRYRRPCKLNYILICRCRDGQDVAEHLHNACLGQNFSQSRDYRYQLWDNQADFTMYLRDFDKRRTCKIRHQTLFGTDNPLIRLEEPEIKTKMRISPVLSHLLTDGQDVIHNDIDIKMDQDIKVNFIVELNKTLETRFYCSGLQSRLQDCRLDGCAEGGLLWISHLSNGQSASRSCIVPVEARVLHQDRLSGFPLCTCLAVGSVLEDLGLWNIRLLWNQGTECSLSLETIPKNIKSLEELYEFEDYALDQMNFDQLSERVVNTTGICPQDGGHKLQICFLASEADNKTESDFHACLTWGSDNLNGSPINTSVIWILICQSIILVFLSHLL